MVVKNIKLTTLYFIISLASLLMILWLVDYAEWGIPTMFPLVQLRTYGILILLAFMLINYLFQKQLQRSDPEISIFKMISLSTIVIFFSLLVYQFIRQNIILERSLSSMTLLSAAGPTIVFIFIVASTTLSLKKITGVAKQIPLVLLLLMFFFFKQYFRLIEW